MSPACIRNALLLSALFWALAGLSVWYVVG